MQYAHQMLTCTCIVHVCSLYVLPVYHFPSLYYVRVYTHTHTHIRSHLQCIIVLRPVFALSRGNTHYVYHLGTEGVVKTCPVQNRTT